MEYKISVPASEEELKKLRAGDSVLLSGTVYTARDAAHKRICECFDNGEAAPAARYTMSARPRSMTAAA
mgnify:CR=1 FL=1